MAIDPLIVNNTCSDLREFHGVIAECVRENKPLPEDLADLFTLEIVVINGKNRGIIRAA